MVDTGKVKTPFHPDICLFPSVQRAARRVERSGVTLGRDPTTARSWKTTPAAGIVRRDNGPATVQYGRSSIAVAQPSVPQMGSGTETSGATRRGE
jgi:hypothetical protein